MAKDVNDNKFWTSDLGLTTTLSIFFNVVDIDKRVSDRVMFAFSDSNELRDIVDSYWRGDLTVDPQKYFSQLKINKSRIYGEG